jgi:signal peptidase II
VPVIDGFFNLVKVTNTGTVFGLAQGWTSALIGLRVAAVFALLWFLRQSPSRDRLQVTALGLIFAGALGNLYDNLFSVERGVRDFLQFYVMVDDRMRDFPAFNVADSCICVGAGLLMICMLRTPPAR